MDSGNRKWDVYNERLNKLLSVLLIVFSVAYLVINWKNNPNALGIFASGMILSVQIYRLFRVKS